MTNSEALTAFLTARGSGCDPAMVALARSLAAAIDANPDVGLAALAKEYRATLKELAGDADRASPLADVLAAMGDPP